MEVVSVDSVLDAVTVYAEGAICRRLAKVSVKPGAAAQLRLNGLPLSLLEGSLRASVVSGPVGLRVRDVRPGFDVALPAEADVPEEQKALERAEANILTLEHERDRLVREIGEVARLKPTLPQRDKGEPPRPTPLDATLALASFVDDRLRELYGRRREVEVALEEARGEVELRRHRIQESSSAVRRERARLTRAAVVTLSLPEGAGDAELALEYMVPGATWAPTYDLRMDRAMRTGRLTLRASVAQRTGEDWKGVRLSLSTARLDRRIEVPELMSLRIGKEQPPPPRSSWREPPPGLAELFVGYDLAFAGRQTQGRPPMQPLPEPLPMPKSLPANGFGGAVPATGMAMPRDGGLDLDEGEAPAEPVPEGAPAMDMLEAEEPTGSFARQELAAAPPPMRRSTGLLARGRAGGPGGGGAPMAPPPAAARPAPAPSMAAPREMAKKRAPLAKEPITQVNELRNRLEATVEPELELSSGLLDYGRLVMAGPEEGGQRGKLRPPTLGEAWELEVYTHVEVRVEVETLVRLRREEARAVTGAPRPRHAGNVRELAGSYDYRFDAERRVDVVGDGHWHTVPVFALEVSLVPEYICVPSVDPKVYRTVRVMNSSKHALLAGPVDVTLGDEFLMTVPMPTMAPGASTRVGLGVEEGVKVSRNTRFNETTGGLLGGAAVLTHGVEIEVANRLAAPVAVEVLERVPVTQEKDIKIEEGPVQPPWTPEDAPRDGVLVEGSRVWRLTLGANEAKKLSAQYAIRIPNQKVLVGGNRRV